MRTRAPFIRATRDSVRYGFAVGKVRVLETRVFGSGTYERLLAAPTFTEQKRILSDTHYGRYLESAETADDVERGLTLALDDVYAFVDEAELPPSVVRFFRERHDFANLKAVLKARALGVPADDMLSDLGTVPLSDLMRPADDLPEFLREAARAAAGGAVEDEVPSTGDIDAAVDRAAYAELALLAKESRSEFLERLAVLMGDLANLKTLVRARRSNMPHTAVEGMLVETGSIPIDRLMEAYAGSAEEIVAAVTRTGVFAGIGLEELADVAQLDVVSDNVIVRFLRTARAVPIGPEPVIAYVLAREAEVVAVRTLLLGKLAGLHTDVLRARMREMYV